MTYAQWIEEQFAKPQTLHRLYMNQAAADLASVGQQLSRTNFFDSYWSQAISGEDQLRQRVAFALSRDLRDLVHRRDRVATNRAASRRTTTCWARTRSATSGSCSRTCRCIR